MNLQDLFNRFERYGYSSQEVEEALVELYDIR